MKAILTFILDGCEDELNDIKGSLVRGCADNIVSVKYDVIQELKETPSVSEIKIPECIIKR